MRTPTGFAAIAESGPVACIPLTEQLAENAQAVRNEDSWPKVRVKARRARTATTTPDRGVDAPDHGRKGGEVSLSRNQQAQAIAKRLNEGMAKTLATDLPWSQGISVGRVLDPVPNLTPEGEFGWVVTDAIGRAYVVSVRPAITDSEEEKSALAADESGRKGGSAESAVAETPSTTADGSTAIDTERLALCEVFSIDKRTDARQSFSIFEGNLAHLAREIDRAVDEFGADTWVSAERVWLDVPTAAAADHGAKGGENMSNDPAAWTESELVEFTTAISEEVSNYDQPDEETMALYRACEKELARRWGLGRKGGAANSSVAETPSTTYVGIDYSMGMSNIDRATGEEDL